MGLKKDTSIYLATNIASKTIPFLLLPLLTHYLKPEEFGMIEMFIMVATFMNILVGLSAESAISRAYFDISHKEELARYTGTSFMILLLNFVAVIFFITIFRKYLNSITHLSFTCLILASLYSLSKTITLTNLQLWRMELKTFCFAIFLTPQTLLEICLSVLLVMVLFDWRGRVYAMVITAGLFGLASLWLLKKRGYLSWIWDSGDAASMLRYCLPLLPHNISSWIKGYLDVLIISNFVGVRAVGIYSVSMILGKGILILIESFSQAWLPHVFNAISKEETDKLRIVRHSYLYMTIIVVVAILYVVVAPFIFKFFIEDQYYEAFRYLPYLVAAWVFDGFYRMFALFILYQKRTGLISAVTTFSSVIHVVGLIFFVKTYGLLGAAITIMFSYFITFLLIAITSVRTYPMPWSYLWTQPK